MEWKSEMHEMEQSVHICGDAHHNPVSFDAVWEIKRWLRNAPLTYLADSPTPICIVGQTIHFACESEDQARRLTEDAAQKVSEILSEQTDTDVLAKFVVTPKVWLRNKSDADFSASIDAQERQRDEERREIERVREKERERLAALEEKGIGVCWSLEATCEEMASGMLADATEAGVFRGTMDNYLRDRYESTLANCRCFQRRRMVSQIPQQLRHMTFNNFTCGGNAARILADALDTSLRYAEDPEKAGWLTLWGGPGVGKTHLAIGILHASPVVGKYIAWGPTQEKLNILMGKPDHSEFWQELLEAPLLLVDDLGAEYQSEWAQYQSFKLIDYRYSHALPTIITTNLRVDGLTGRAGSRIRDRHNGQVIHIDAPDYRIGGR